MRRADDKSGKPRQLPEPRREIRGSHRLELFVDDRRLIGKVVAKDFGQALGGI